MFRCHNVLLSLCLAIAPVLVSQGKTMATPLEEIQKRGVLHVAVKEDVRPLGFRDSSGQLQGLEIDIARQLALDILGDADAVELIPVSNQARLNSLLTGEVDLVIAQMGLNESRRRLVDFSPYYYLDGIGFVTRQSGLTDLQQITTQKVVVLRYSQAIAAVHAYFPNVTLIGADSYQEALNLLETGQADLFAGDHSVLTGWTQEYPNYRFLPAWLDGNALAIAIPKGRQHQSLNQEIQNQMLEWQKSGWLQDRINHWGLP
jgi:polar amino acid transport system substrate-binding protein